MSKRSAPTFLADACGGVAKLATFAVLGLSASAALAGLGSELIIIEPEPEFRSLIAVEINDRGDVLINRIRPSGATVLPTYWGAVWNAGEWRSLPVPAPVQSVCPANINYPPSYGNWRTVKGGAMNNAGTVVGGLIGDGCSGNFMVTWNAGGGTSIARTSRQPDCISPYPSSGCSFTALGDDGTAGGLSSCGCGVGAGSLLRVGSAGFLEGASSTNGIYTAIADINAHGVIVGSAQNGNGNVYGQRWTSPTSVTNLGEGPAVAINDHGWIVGGFGLWRDGVATSLNPPGTPAALTISPVDINDVGSILGSTVVEVNGVRYTLESLGLNRPGYTNWAPVAINNRHWIAGTVTLADGTNRSRVFVLKPGFECFRFTDHPDHAAVCPTGDAVFSVAVTDGGGPFTYQWQRLDTLTGQWLSFSTEPAVGPCTASIAPVTPGDMSSVRIAIRPCPTLQTIQRQHFMIRCVVSNPCGELNSQSATYTTCAADFSCSGGITIDDIFIYLNAWFAADPRSDVNGDGVTIDDIFIYLNAWFTGC